VVERIQQRLDDVVAWFANALSPMLAVVVACRGDQFLTEMIYAGTKRWNQKHYALLKQRKKVGRPMCFISNLGHNVVYVRACVRIVRPPEPGVSFGRESCL
jgi:hypothetical protein